MHKSYVIPAHNNTSSVIKHVLNYWRINEKHNKSKLDPKNFECIQQHNGRSERDNTRNDLYIIYVLHSANVYSNGVRTLFSVDQNFHTIRDSCVE